MVTQSKEIEDTIHELVLQSSSPSSTTVKWKDIIKPFVPSDVQPIEGDSSLTYEIQQQKTSRGGKPRKQNQVQAIIKRKSGKGRNSQKVQSALDRFGT